MYPFCVTYRLPSIYVVLLTLSGIQFSHFSFGYALHIWNNPCNLVVIDATYFWLNMDVCQRNYSPEPNVCLYIVLSKEVAQGKKIFPSRKVCFFFTAAVLLVYHIYLK